MNRIGFIGGSDVPAILEISSFKTKWALYQEKLGNSEPSFNDERKQRFLNRRKRMEPFIIELIKDELNDRKVDHEIVGANNVYTHADYDFLRAEIDFEIVIDGKKCNGEIKTVSPFNTKEWGEQYTDVLPMPYIAQVMHGLAVTNRDLCIVVALIGVDDMRIYFVERDDDLIDIITKQCVQFWHDVQNKIEPELKEIDVNEKYKIANDQAFVADQKLSDIHFELAKLQQKMKLFEKHEADLKTKAKILIGENSLVQNADNLKLFSWKNQTSNRLDVDLIKNERPDIYNQYLKQSVSRVFKIYK
jgi:putative phage-type endonuclease